MTQNFTRDQMTLILTTMGHCMVFNNEHVNIDDIFLGQFEEMWPQCKVIM